MEAALLSIKNEVHLSLAHGEPTALILHDLSASFDTIDHDILYATDIPLFTNYMRMTPEFFEMLKTRLEPCLARQATNYRAPISVGEKLALTIRYLATGESYTSLSCQFRVSRSTISKFLPDVCRVIQDEFTREYLRCPTTPDEWKELEREFRIRWNAPGSP